MAAMISHSRRRLKTTIGWLVLLQLGVSVPAAAQASRPYLTKATFYMAVDGWVDIYINGIPIIESQPSTPEDKTIQITKDIPEHLCYFKNENILAIENANAFNAPSPLKSQIGFAYILLMKFSDGTELTLSSNDISEHKAYYLPDRESGEPRNWHYISFDDSSWATPYSLGTMVPGITMLTDLGSRQGIQFLSALGTNPKARYAGERHLYRREFSLNISQNPNCPPVEAQVVKRPAKRVSAATPAPIAARETVWVAPTFTPSSTEIPRPAFIWKPTLTPTPIPQAVWTAPPQRPSPTATPRLIFIWQASPTPTIVFVPTSVPTPVPTWTFTFYPTAIPAAVPRRVIRPIPTWPPVITPTRIISKRPKWRKPIPTPVPVFGGSSRVEPIQTNAPLVPTAIPTALTTVGVTAEPSAAQAQTIVFKSQPANIYISYADGPGVYRLEVVDSSRRHLRALFEKRVVAQPDDWVEWDGKDDAGQEVPAGQYTVLYTKDGRELNRLILVKTAEH